MFCVCIILDFLTAEGVATMKKRVITEWRRFVYIVCLSVQRQSPHIHVLHIPHLIYVKGQPRRIIFIAEEHVEPF
jgi:hypothetical protein